MNRTSTSAIALGISGAVVGTIAFAGQALAAPPVTPGPRWPVPAASATPAVATERLAADLAWMREEERLARDVYAALAAKYDNALPFANIVRSEQQHFDAVGVLLARYGVADPSRDKPAGTYAEPELQEMYDRLMAQGGKSLADAYGVGIAIEQADIADLKRVQAETSEPDVNRVWTNLLRGSEQHLKAFEAAKSGAPLTHTGAGMGPRSGAGAGAGAGWGGQGMGPRR